MFDVFLAGADALLGCTFRTGLPDGVGTLHGTLG